MDRAEASTGPVTGPLWGCPMSPRHPQCSVCTDLWIVRIWREICSVFAQQMHRQPREIQGMERRGRDSILNKDSWCLLAPNDRSDSSIKGKYIAPFYSCSGSYIFDVQGFLIFCKITFKVFLNCA